MPPAGPGHSWLGLGSLRGPFGALPGPPGPENGPRGPRGPPPGPLPRAALFPLRNGHSLFPPRDGLRCGVVPKAPVTLVSEVHKIFRDPLWLWAPPVVAASLVAAAAMSAAAMVAACVDNYGLGPRGPKGPQNGPRRAPGSKKIGGKWSEIVPRFKWTDFQLKRSHMDPIRGFSTFSGLFFL